MVKTKYLSSRDKILIFNKKTNGEIKTEHSETKG